jgi:hypothetical protein
MEAHMSGKLVTEDLGAACINEFARPRLLVDLASRPDLSRLREIVSGAWPGKELIAGTV